MQNPERQLLCYRPAKRQGMNEKYFFVKNVASFFAILCILFIPFSFSLISFQLEFTDFVFGKLIGFVSDKLLGIHLKDTKVYSDFVSMYVLVMLLFILAVVAALIVARLNKWKQYRRKILGLCYTICCYYLILQLLKYGFGKIFKDQFYLPEPNTLYTPLGQLDKDILYWSSMGTSRLYNLFSGSVEVLAAILLLFKRTRMAGLLLATASLSQIVAINFSFDISVKLFSLFLLFLSLYLLNPFYNRLYHFFFTRSSIQAMEWEASSLNKHPFLSVFFKCLITGLIFFEALYPYFRKSNFNDDVAKRPYLHGAYEVKQMIVGQDTLSANNFQIKRFFIHRDSYLIFQNQADKMQDYKLSYNIDKYEYTLTDYQLKIVTVALKYNPTDSVLVVKYFKNDRQYEVTGKALDWKKLPLMNSGFHWTVDRY